MTPLNQAVIRAADAIEAMQEIPSVADIAAEVGVTRQYLYRLANREIVRRAKEKAEPLTRASAKTQPGDTKIGPSRSYPAHDIPNGGK